MIRSLVAPESEQVEGEEFALRRNLSQENLEVVVKAGEITWIDVVDSTEGEIRWLEQLLELGPSVVADLKREDRRPAMLVYPKYLFLSLFQPYIQATKVGGKEIHCLIGEKYFVTVRTADSTAVDEAYNRTAQNPDSWQRGVAYFLYLTSQYVVDTYYPLLDRMSVQLSEIEEQFLNGGIDKQAQKPIYRIKQQLIGLRQMVAPQREVLSNVIGEQRLAGNDDTRDLFRHLYERLLRVYDVIDAQRDLASNVLDMIENSESRRIVEAVNRLTIFSMIFLPLTFLTGFFQLNFATTSEPIILPITGAVMLLIVLLLMIFSAATMLFFFRRKGWL
jgi:magnesium transporter